MTGGVDADLIPPQKKNEKKRKEINKILKNIYFEIKKKYVLTIAKLNTKAKRVLREVCGVFSRKRLNARTVEVFNHACVGVLVFLYTSSLLAQ